MKARIRKAQLRDGRSIQALVNHYAGLHLLLPRSLIAIYENIRDFWVVEEEGAALVGCCALHVCWEELGEVKSLAVRPDRERRGIGRRLVEACIGEAHKLGLRRLFALTYKVDFFLRMGFREVPKSELPHKVWSECIHCVKFPDCGEVAMVLDLGPTSAETESGG